jgi:plasmid stabilization system protein ParE
MADYKVRLTTPAMNDIDRIANYYLMMADAAAAEKITDKLLDSIQHLEKFPFMGALHPDPVLAKNEYRKLICEDYICVYKVIEDTVYIYRVVNGKTDYPKLFY